MTGCQIDGGGKQAASRDFSKVFYICLLFSGCTSQLRLRQQIETRRLGGRRGVTDRSRRRDEVQSIIRPRMMAVMSWHWSVLHAVGSSPGFLSLCTCWAKQQTALDSELRCPASSASHTNPGLSPFSSKFGGRVVDHGKQFEDFLRLLLSRSAVFPPFFASGLSAATLPPGRGCILGLRSRASSTSADALPHRTLPAD